MEVFAEDVVISLGEKTILHGVTIDAKNREMIGIIGPNGSGKSTLLKCIYRILTPEKGKIYFQS